MIHGFLLLALLGNFARAEENKAVKFFLECVSMTDDDVLCFEEAKPKLIEFVEAEVDKAVVNCEYVRRKTVIIQEGIAKQRKAILKSALDAKGERKSGLYTCLEDRVKKLFRVEVLLAERANFTRMEIRQPICRETSGFLSMIGIHAQFIGKQAHLCFQQKMPKTPEPLF